LNASDEDEGENSRLRYEIVDDADWPSRLGDDSDDDDDDDDDDDVARLPLFAVDADSGIVTAVASLDRETSPQHRFQVRHLITVVYNYY